MKRRDNYKLARVACEHVIGGVRQVSECFSKRLKDIRSDQAAEVVISIVCDVSECCRRDRRVSEIDIIRQFG